MYKPHQYKCDSCGQMHEGWPALTYDQPLSWMILSEEEKEKGELTSDFCIIDHEDGTYRFIRVVLIQKVIDHCEDLEYGVWVSLSEKSFDDYKKNFKNSNHTTSYFGWFNSLLNDYEDTAGIPMTVETQAENQRPIIFPHKDHDHEFVRDFYSGISKKEAETRVNDLLRKHNLI